MSLADLAEDFSDFIALNLTSLKSGFTYASVTELKLFICLDPIVRIEQSKDVIGIYVAPITVEYNISESNSRGKVKSLNMNPRIGVFIYTIAQTTDPLDFASWPEAKEILNFREKLEKLLATHDWGVNIVDIAAEPPMETSLKKSSFISVTEFVLGTQGC